MTAGGAGLWKTILLPPLFALLLYLLTSFLILPYYRRWRSHASYDLLPSSLSPANASPSSFTGKLFSRLSTILGRRRSSGAELLGDEELEEGYGDITNSVLQDRTHMTGAAELNGGGRRLSRELERGFRDSSDEDEEDDRGRGRR